MESTKPALSGTVSEHDREYMRRIGRWKHESHQLALAEHLAMNGTERLVTSAVWTMGNASLPTWRFRADDCPERFYERAKELGLYRP